MGPMINRIPQKSAIHVRPATPADAQAMSAILAEILAGWKSERPSDPSHVLAQYIAHPDRVECSVATDANGTILGFQSLRLATADNPYGVAPGWGIIGTYVKRGIGRRGIGSALFAATARAARQAGLEEIDATIGESNEDGQAYYEAMGFRTYRDRPGAVCKRYVVAEPTS